MVLLCRPPVLFSGVFLVMCLGMHTLSLTRLLFAHLLMFVMAPRLHPPLFWGPPRNLTSSRVVFPPLWSSDSLETMNTRPIPVGHHKPLWLRNAATCTINMAVPGRQRHLARAPRMHKKKKKNTRNGRCVIFTLLDLLRTTLVGEKRTRHSQKMKHTHSHTGGGRRHHRMPTTAQKEESAHDDNNDHVVAPDGNSYDQRTDRHATCKVRLYANRTTQQQQPNIQSYTKNTSHTHNKKKQYIMTTLGGRVR